MEKKEFLKKIPFIDLPALLLFLMIAVILVFLIQYLYVYFQRRMSAEFLSLNLKDFGLLGKKQIAITAQEVSTETKFEKTNQLNFKEFLLQLNKHTSKDAPKHFAQNNQRLLKEVFKKSKYTVQYLDATQKSFSITADSFSEIIFKKNPDGNWIKQ